MSMKISKSPASLPPPGSNIPNCFKAHKVAIIEDRGWKIAIGEPRSLK
jgi:hypothetical protein